MTVDYADISPQELRRLAEAELSSLPPVKRPERQKVVRQPGIWPVHRGALRGESKLKPWPLNRASRFRVLAVAERIRQKRPVPRRDVTMIDRYGYQITVDRPTKYGGYLTKNDIEVLKELMSFFGKNGTAWPSYAAIAERAGLGINTVKKSIAYLEQLGIICKQQRCRGKVVDGVYFQVQDTNEYAIVPPTEWNDYDETLEPQPPAPETYGKTLRTKERADMPTEAEQAREAELAATLARTRARGGG